MREEKSEADRRIARGDLVKMRRDVCSKRAFRVFNVAVPMLVDWQSIRDESGKSIIPADDIAIHHVN
jgi:hypothetical protein